MISSGTGDPVNSRPLTSSRKVLHWPQSSSHPIPPGPSASKPIALTLQPVQCSPKSARPMINGTPLHFSPSPYHRSNAITRFMTRRCSQSFRPYRNGITLSKGPNTNSKSGPTTKTWSTSCWLSNLIRDKPNGHSTSPGLTSSYTTNLVGQWGNQMHFHDGLIMALEKVIIPTSPSSLPSSLQSEP